MKICQHCCVDIRPHEAYVTLGADLVAGSEEFTLHFPDCSESWTEQVWKPIAYARFLERVQLAGYVH